MKKKDRLEMYDKCMVKWGLYPQYDQCVEEMAELTVAINKMKRKYVHDQYKGDKSIDANFLEELADVTICIEQLTNYAGKAKVTNEVNKKLKKLQRHLSK